MQNLTYKNPSVIPLKTNVIDELIVDPTIQENPSLCSTFFLPEDDLRDFTYYIYKNEFDIKHWLFGNPSEAIINCIYFPFFVKMDLDVGMLRYAQGTITNINPFLSSEPLNYIYRVGKFKWSPKYEGNDFRNYSGYTKLKVFLPYFGYINLKPDDIIGKWVHIFLKPDFTTGRAIYVIAVSDNEYSYANVGIEPLTESSVAAMDFIIIDTIEFQLGTFLPIGSTNNSSKSRDLALGVIGTAVAAATAMAPVAAASATSTVTKSTHTSFSTRNPTTNRLNKAATIDKTQTSSKSTIYDNTEYVKQQRRTEAFDKGIDVLNSFNYDMSTHGAVSEILNGSLPLNIYLVEYTPKYVTQDEEFNRLYGRPLGEVRKLQNVRGYTEISRVHIEGALFSNATEDEISMLYNEIFNGIIL